MILHPILGTAGFDELKTIRPAEGSIYRSMAKSIMIDAVADILKELPQSSQPLAENTPRHASSTAASATTSVMSRIAMLKQIRAETHASNFEAQSTPQNAEEKATALVESYLSYNFDSTEELKRQLIRMGKDPNAEDIDWDQAEDCLYFSSKFHLLEWWKCVGCKKWPEVYLVFCIWIALPNSNSFQERIFSLYTWFDNPLRQSLKETRFEMAVLLAVNDAFICTETPTDAETVEIMKTIVATFEKELGSDVVADLQSGFDSVGLVDPDDKDSDSDFDIE